MKLIHKDAVTIRNCPRLDILTEAMETFHLVGEVLIEISNKNLCKFIAQKCLIPPRARFKFKSSAIWNLIKMFIFPEGEI